MLRENWQKATLNFRIYAYMQQLMTEARLPAEEVLKIQFSRLKKLLCEVYQTHPFYQERFDASRFDPFKMADISELKNVPILDKEDYRTLIKSLVEEKGEKWTEIAKEIFPEDFDPEKHGDPESAVVKVHHGYKEAKILIAEGLP